jgi:hypothetical protein
MREREIETQVMKREIRKRLERERNSEKRGALTKHGVCPGAEVQPAAGTDRTGDADELSKLVERGIGEDKLEGVLLRIAHEGIGGRPDGMINERDNTLASIKLSEDAR